MRRPVAVIAVVLSVAGASAARCAPAGGWHPQLPVMSRIEWMNQEPLDKPIRFGPKPAYGEWIQLGWTRVPWDGVRRVPVWQQLGPRLYGGEAG